MGDFSHPKSLMESSEPQATLARGSFSHVPFQMGQSRHENERCCCCRDPLGGCALRRGTQGGCGGPVGLAGGWGPWLRLIPLTGGDVCASSEEVARMGSSCLKVTCWRDRNPTAPLKGPWVPGACLLAVSIRFFLLGFFFRKSQDFRFRHTLLGEELRRLPEDESTGYFTRKGLSCHPCLFLSFSFSS